MNEQPGKKLKLLSTITFIALSLVFIVLAFCFMKSKLVLSFVFIALAVVCAVLLIPFYKIADNMAKTASKRKASPADIYSPTYIRTSTNEYKNAKGQSSQAEYRKNASTKDIPAVKRNSPMSEDFTRELTIPKDISEISDPFAPLKEETPETFFTTTTIDKIAINHKEKSVTKFMDTERGFTLAAGGLHTVAVKESGNVIATGFNSYGQCDVESFQNVISVTAGAYHTPPSVTTDIINVTSETGQIYARYPPAPVTPWDF